MAPIYERNGGEICAQSLRGRDKTFRWIGEPARGGLFGHQLWGSGRKLVITEGFIDAMSLSQVQDHRWPVVSVLNGAGGAEKDIRNNLEYCLRFDEVIFMFDMDEPGQSAARRCAALLPPGRAKIASLPLKDPNECLVKGEVKALVSAIWNASPYRPDGILSTEDLRERVFSTKGTDAGIPYPWESLNDRLGGIRRSEIVMICAGSGVGKSSVLRELGYSVGSQGHNVGIMMLEEGVERSARSLMGLSVDQPLGRMVWTEVPDETKLEAWEKTLGTDRYFFYDHFGSNRVDVLLDKIRYFAVALDCKYIILDHISIIVSGLADGDERRVIDNLMTDLRTLVQELDIALFAVSHLKRPDKRGHEEGAQTSLSQLRGSHSIAQLSDIVLGLERDQQGDNPDITTVRILKNRWNGITGEAEFLEYSHETGRLEPAGSNYGFEEDDEGSGRASLSPETV